MEYYFKVFYESAWTNSLIPFATDATFSAINLFGGYNMPIAAMIATAGATLGLTSNWLLGYALMRMRNGSKLQLKEAYYNRASILFNKYGIFLLLFTWVPLFKIIMIFAGFLNAPLKFVLPLAVIGQLFYYMHQI